MTSKLVYNVESAGPSRLESLDRHCRKRSPDGALLDSHISSDALSELDGPELIQPA